MDKYTVKLYPKAYRDLDEIYSYIAENLSEVNTAEQTIDAIEEAIFALEIFPERGSLRRTGIYAHRDYRQIFVKNYVIVYKVEKEEHEVHIVTVRYVPSDF